MYIKVYKDGSKIKSKVAGLTFRQFIFLLSIAGVTGLIMINNFFLHISSLFFEFPLMLLLFISFFVSLVKINGLTGDRWFKLKWNYLKKPTKRTYQTERIVQYERKEFIQSKKVKETDTFIEDWKATIKPIEKECAKSKK